jgi:hypothetical protein
MTFVFLAFAQLTVVDVWFRLQEFSLGTKVIGGDGITYLPFDLSAVICGVLVAASVLVVALSNRGRTVEHETLQLGNAWMLASVPLVLDNLIDTFEVKIPIIILFVIVGLRYWKGIRNSHLSLMLSPFVALIVAADGLGHLAGNFCGPGGLDACSVKAISDTYLLMIMLVLTYLTIAGRNQRPRLMPLIMIILIFALALLGLLLSP